LELLQACCRALQRPARAAAASAAAASTEPEERGEEEEEEEDEEEGALPLSSLRVLQQLLRASCRAATPLRALSTSAAEVAAAERERRAASEASSAAARDEPEEAAAAASAAASAEASASFALTLAVQCSRVADQSVIVDSERAELSCQSSELLCTSTLPA
jgi:hypothetical protein